MKKLFSLLLGLAMLFTATHAQTGQVHILSVNDMHASIDRFPQFAFLADSLRSLYPDLLILSAGDNRTGNPVNDLYPEPCRPVVDLMNLVGFNYSAVGNHEFDGGAGGLRSVVNHSNCRYLCANVVTPDTMRLHIEPFRLLRNGDIRIALLGLLQVGKNGYPDAHPKNFKQIYFRNPIEVAREYAWLRQQSDVFIILSHNGYEDDIELAKALPEADLIVGGHSHTLVADGTMAGDSVLVTQAKNNLRYATFTTLTVDGGKVTDRKTQTIDVTAASKKNEAALQLVDKYNKNSTLNEVLATAEAFNNRQELGCLMTDAFRINTGADISVQNCGGVRLDDKEAGNFTLNDVYRLSPFNNEMFAYTVTGDELTTILQALCTSDASYGPPFVSGITYTVTMDKKTNKIKSIDIRTANGKKFDRKRTYRLVLNSYMANVTKELKERQGTNLFVTESEETAKYLRAQKHVDYRGAERMRIVYK